MPAEEKTSPPGPQDKETQPMTEKPENGPAPKDIKQIDETRLGITWTDGKESVYDVKMLRESCPCAHCIDEWSGQKKISP
ncbi:MAG: gamma-butyrobetaine hydroxylase-like domain-containing protein, partial [Nitrospinaceae bacterium]